MNIRSRIQKLENQIIYEKQFCDCWMIYHEKIIGLVYDGIPYDDSKTTLPEGGFCEKCKKEVSESDLKIQKDVQRIYGDNL